jgi:NADPH-dependent 2,4-dienoyl-CoA reductase/sulfur reductase-like enzyme/ferredoxin
MTTTEAPSEAKPVFQNYTELPRVIPIRVWAYVRLLTVLLLLALCAFLFVKPKSGLMLFWGVVVPLLPLLYLIAPGVWRNICPASAANQTPRVFHFTRGWTAPDWLKDNTYLISIVLFFGAAASRLVLFNDNAAATAIALLGWMAIAFVGGFLFKGKSGWCSSMCPLLPVQRMYGQTPYLVSPNSHCQPCVGCTKNCYDFNPKPAYQADMHDEPSWSARRKFFVGAFPGFVLGFNVLHMHPKGTVETYITLALYMGASVGLFFALDALLRISASKLAGLFAASAFNIFYWFDTRGALAPDIKYYFHTSGDFIIWPLRVLVLLITLVWIGRTFRVEKQYEKETAPASVPVKIGKKAAAALKSDTGAGSDGPQVQFTPDDHAAVAELGASLLEVAEKDGKAIEAGCRMGICGADPVAVLEGMTCLSEPEKEEISTLRRLGLAASTRMACCARLQTAGTVKVSLTPEKGDASAAKVTEYDRSITSVVVLGNGIAGATAADYVRRGHPDCEIHVVGREAHVLYNRMGISRLIYGRSAMQGLYLLPEDWYDEHGITAWLNTAAAGIDTNKKTVTLRTGDSIPWDRLIIALGSSSMVPTSVEGFGRPGTFVVREAGDAIQLRAYAQEHGSRRAVVAGAGLLGLEAAHAIHELGLHVTVLDRGSRLLAKQIDERCSEMVFNYLTGLGIDVLTRAETKSLPGQGPISEVLLTDDRTIPCDVFVVAVGIRANADLAKQAGITVNRGVVVDDYMRTNVPGVYAAGDVAEHNGVITGLWPTAVRQAEVAATNALGGDDHVDFEPPVCILKGVGLELTSAGRFEETPADMTIILDEPWEPSYRKLVIGPDNKVAGMIVLGHHPEDITAAVAAVKNQTQVPHAWLYDLRQGNWKILKSQPPKIVVESLEIPTAHPFRPDPSTPRACRDCGRPMADHVAERRV